ncbi:toxin regulator [Neobacillus cucumis]|uniref:toxin regulator n=1 Tax=Neobacillus cucumis TaxID=1740721 RepID=UPI0028536F5C|nr:toxin regulator [Neobacillus cucumis]MDR4948123.1 toxin regulator [Neobacillus cucumis]
MKVLGFLKKRWKYVLTAIIALIIGASGGPSQDQLDKVNAKVDSLNKQLKTEKTEVASLTNRNQSLQAKVDEAEPWFKMSDEQKKQQEAAAKAAEEKRLADEKAAQAKAEAEAKAKADAEAKAKAAAEAKAKAEAEAQARIGYNTGITYDQLARTPDNYTGQKVKFRGKVIQVIEGDGETQIRLAVNDDYDKVLFAAFDSSTVTSRVLEDDMITIYGTSSGLITYDSTMGGKISIPGVAIDKIDQ